MQAVRFGHALTVSDGIVKKLVSLHQWPLPRMMPPLACVMREGEHLALCMVAAPFLESFEMLVQEHGGTITSSGPGRPGTLRRAGLRVRLGAYAPADQQARPQPGQPGGAVPRPGPAGGGRALGQALQADVGPMHFEAKRIGGAVGFQGAPVFPYTGEDAAGAHHRLHAGRTAPSAANNHTFLVRENGMKPVDDTEIAFKRSMDPYNLLNPGKLAIDALSVSASAGAKLGAKGWWKDAPATAESEGAAA